MAWEMTIRVFARALAVAIRLKTFSTYQDLLCSKGIYTEPI